jgi:activator of HSP90 ATPase
MTRAIQQSIIFKASLKTLYEMYMDSKKHSEATGGAARISRKPGGRFTAWNGLLSGKNLLIVPNRMIVQAWRSCNFKAGDADSILVIGFSKHARGGRVDLVHINVPPQDHKGVSQGWPIYYWQPWRKYLAAHAARSRR